MAMTRLCRLKVTSRDSPLSCIALLAATLVATCSVGFISIFSVFYNALLEKYGESKEKTAWISSIPYSLMFILGPIASWVVNKLGLRISTMLASIPLSASLLLTSFMSDLDYMFITFSIPFGLGASVLLVASIKVICIYFDKWLSLAYGASTGGISFVLVGLSYLMVGQTNTFGLNRTFQILSGVFFVICFLAALAFIPTAFPSEGQADEDAERKSIMVYFKLLKNKKLCVFLFANFIFSFSYSISYLHQVRLAIEKGVSRNMAEQFPVFTSISIGIGRIFCGLVLDVKIKKRISFMQCCMVLVGLNCFLGLLAETQTHFIVFIWIFGALDGMVQAAVTPALRETMGLELLSEAYSLVLTADAIALLVGPPFVGFVVDRTNDYDAFFYITGTPYLIAACILLFLHCFNNATVDVVNGLEMKTAEGRI